MLKLKLLIILSVVGSQLLAQDVTFRDRVEQLQTELHSWQSKDSLKQVSASLLKIGMAYSNEYVLDSSDYYLQKSLDLSNELGITDYLAKTNIYLGLNASVAGNHAEANKYYNRALEEYSRREAWHDVAGILMNIGIEYKIAGDYQMGLNYCLKAVDTKLVHNDSSDLVRYYLQITSLYNDIGNQKKRKEYLFVANTISNDTRMIEPVTFCQLYNELGEYYYSNNKTDSAKFYFEKMLSQSKEIDNSFFIVSANNSLGLIYFDDGDLERAAAYHKENETLVSEETDFYVDNKINYSRVLYAQGNKKEAFKKIRESIAVAHKNEYKSLELKATEVYVDFLSDSKKFEEAFVEQKKVLEIKSFLHKENLASSTADMEAKYQNKFKQLQIDNLQQEKKVNDVIIRNQQLVIWGSVGLLILLLVGVFYYFKNLRAEASLRETKLNYSLFRSQMNPHFMFNALQAIQLFMFKNDKMETAGYLTSFAKLMRQILDYSSEEFISIEDEISLIENYVKLQQLRFDDGFDFSIEIDDTIDVYDAQIPPMLIQPLVENALEHGLKPLGEKGKLVLKIYEENKLIKVEVIDNGVGVKENSAKVHNSKALKLIKEQLSRLSVKDSYFEIIDLHLSDSNLHGVKAVFAYPISIAYKS